MRKSLAAVVAVVALAGVVGQALGSGNATPTHYKFAFAFAFKPKPDDVTKFPAVKVTGTGAGTFSIKNRRQDRDGTFFWQIYGAKATFSLSIAGKPFFAGTITGGVYGTDGPLRTANFFVKPTTNTRFHCAKPAAEITVEANTQIAQKGDTQDFVVSACGASARFSGRPPALVETITPTG